MYPHLIPTLEALGIDPSEDAIAILRRSFNRTKSDDCLYKVREFITDGGSKRFIGLNSLGESVVIVQDELPEIGSLISSGGKNYYVETHLDQTQDIAAATSRNPDPKQANGNRKTSA